MLRDLVQRRLGVGFAFGAILAGAALSAVVAPPALVIASAVAFLLSETRRLSRSIRRSRAGGWSWRWWPRAWSGWWSTSIVFLWLAFGSLDFLVGQIVGKAWMVLLLDSVRRSGCAAATKRPVIEPA